MRCRLQANDEESLFQIAIDFRFAQNDKTDSHNMVRLWEYNDLDLRRYNNYADKDSVNRSLFYVFLAQLCLLSKEKILCGVQLVLSQSDGY